jgi:hypothetical protein
MPEYDDDGGRADAARVKKACAALLADLRQHELYPDQIANEDVDKWPQVTVPGLVGLLLARLPVLGLRRRAARRPLRGDKGPDVSDPLCSQPSHPSRQGRLMPIRTKISAEADTAQIKASLAEFEKYRAAPAKMYGGGALKRLTSQPRQAAGGDLLKFIDLDQAARSVRVSIRLEQGGARLPWASYWHPEAGGASCGYSSRVRGSIEDYAMSAVQARKSALEAIRNAGG